MNGLIKINYSENTSSVLADVKIEVTGEVTQEEIDKQRALTEKLFSDAQNFALLKTMNRKK